MLGDQQQWPSALHPALVGALWRRGRVRGFEAAATIVRLIELGALTVRPVAVDGAGGPRSSARHTIEFGLVPGFTTARRGVHRPFVTQGHVPGLSKIDRLLLSIMFDRIAGAPDLSLYALRRFANEHPWRYWQYLKEWRGAVRDEASHLQLERGDLIALRQQVASAVSQGESLDLATALGQERVAIEAVSRTVHNDRSSVLFRAGTGRAPIVELRRLLSKRYPLGYSPPSRVGYTPVPSRAKGLVVRADEE